MSFRQVLTIASLVLAAAVFVGQVRKLLADPTIWPPDDFIEYWAAAKLTLTGANPYDSELLLPLQQANGRHTDEAVMMWNPPWALAIVLPLGLVPAREAQLLWLGINLSAMCFCGDRLWQLLGGSRERRWVGWGVVLAALPTAFALQSGQISPLLLLGAVLFLDFQRRGWPGAAGAATMLLAVKPHLAYLVWAAILCDAITRGRWRIVLGGVVAGITCAAVPLLFNPHVWTQYAEALATRPPAQWVSPTLGTLLRLAFGEELFRLQFVPMLAGLVWFAFHWRMHRVSWNWTEQLPLLLLVSFLTAPYGAWPFDMVLLLPAVVSVFLANGVCQPSGVLNQGVHTHCLPDARRFTLLALILVNLGCLVLNVLKVTSFWFLWVSPAVLLIYVVAAAHPRIHLRGSPGPGSPGMVPT